MEFIHKGGIPSEKLFYFNSVIDPFTGETLEDFGFKEDCVVMTQDEYDTLKIESEAKNEAYIDQLRTNHRIGFVPRWVRSKNLYSKTKT